MSFNDFGSSRSTTETRSAQNIVPGNTLGTGLDNDVREIGEMLTRFQASCNSAKNKIDAAGKSAVSASAKTELDNMMKALKGLASHVKEKLDEHVRQVNALPRDQAVGRRVSVVKLQKDYERVKQQHQTILSNYSTVRVDRNAGTSSGRSAGGSFSNAYDNSAGVDVGPHGSQQQQHHILQLQGQDVEDMIIEERAKDIQKINQDLVLVNEMFRDMAQIVEGQGKTIEKIAEDTEASRERAEQGLAEVKQAAVYQPGCILS